MISASTRVFALLGDPVDHSLSPRVQNAAIRSSGLDAVYVALRCDADDVGLLIRAIARAGGGGNVTAPHKERAARAVDSPGETVTRTASCNTFWAEAGRTRGENTDVEGFRAAAGLLLGSPAGARVLLLGAGGAARAVLCALLDSHVDAVLVVNRSPERARSMVDAFGGTGRRIRLADRTGLRREGFDLVVNATSLGRDSADPVPLDFEEAGRVGAVLDLVYGNAPTELVRRATEAGIPALDGREMLLQQAAAAFRYWFDRPAPVKSMRRALGEGA